MYIVYTLSEFENGLIQGIEETGLSLRVRRGEINV